MFPPLLLLTYTQDLGEDPEVILLGPSLSSLAELPASLEILVSQIWLAERHQFEYWLVS